MYAPNRAITIHIRAGATRINLLTDHPRGPQPVRTLLERYSLKNKTRPLGRFQFQVSLIAAMRSFFLSGGSIRNPRGFGNIRYGLQLPVNLGFRKEFQNELPQLIFTAVQTNIFQLFERKTNFLFRI